MPAPVPIRSLTAASFILTFIVIGNAYYHKRQFYPSVVYITKSNPSMTVIYLLAFTLVILFGKVLKKVFFGQLRAAEFEHLIERSFYTITETCLAFTVFRDDFSAKFVALFTVLLFLKVFHWLADYRVDYMERSPVITLLFHIRVSCLLLLLGLIDSLLVSHAYNSTITKGPTVQLVFGFEYAILFTISVNIAIKYICHTIDLQSENPWENKAVYLLYSELLVGFVKVVLYIIFMYIMISIHTFPLFIIRPMYLTMRAFRIALNDVIQSRRAIHNMNTLYPDATAEELAAVDNVCIICREEMVTGSKKLPCAHIFHASCLRSWFQRQQTCPTCRMDILRHPVPPQPTQPAQQPPQAATPPPAAAAAPTQPAIRGNAANQFAALFGGVPPGFNPFLRPPFPVPGATPPAANGTVPVSTSAGTSAATTTTTASSSTEFSSTPVITSNTSGTATSYTGGPSATPSASFPAAPFGMGPPFFPFMPFNIPVPVAPTNFSGFTEEELRRMEGQERSHVEARIQALRNIQTLLDAAVVQMNQYASVVKSLESSGQSTTSTKAAAPSSSSADATATESDVTAVVSSSAGDAASPLSVSSDLSSLKAYPSSSFDTTSTPKTVESEESGDESSTRDSPEVESDNPQEIRRRRLEKFLSPESN